MKNIDTDLLVKLYNEGKSLKEISIIVNLSEEAIRLRIKDKTIIRSKGGKNLDDNEIKRLYLEENKNATEISKIMNVSHSTIRQHLTKMSIQIKNRMELLHPDLNENF